MATMTRRPGRAKTGRAGKSAKSMKRAGRTKASGAVAKSASSHPLTLNSTLTRRAQTTVPSVVRRALGLGPGDQLEYTIRGDVAVLRKAVPTADADDPVVGGFLRLLAKDIASNPEHVRGMPAALLRRARELTEGVEIDHDAPVDGAIAL